jgi:hypothetical protein
VKHLLIASPTILAALVVLAISLYALYCARRENKAHKAECERWKAELERELAEREATLKEPAVLRVTLDLRDSCAVADLARVARDAERLIASLSDYETSLGGGGLILTEAKATPGQVIFMLTPLDATGAGSRVERVAQALNAAFNPAVPQREAIPNLGNLPGDVSGAHAVPLAA